jgi:hypothetical protein
MKKSGSNVQEPSVFIHLKPKPEELLMAFMEMEAADTLKFLPEWMQTVTGWMAYLNPKPKKPRAIAFCPVVIEVDGRFPAVIILTDWRERGQSAQVHFAAHGQYRPKTVFIACRMALDLILQSKEVDLLEVCFEETNVRSKKMAAALGFVETARVAGCVHSSKTLKGIIYDAKSTETSRSAKSGRSGYSGKRGCSGGGRSRTPETPAAGRQADHLSG